MPNGVVTAQDVGLSLLQSAANEFAQMKQAVAAPGLALPNQHTMVAGAAQLAAVAGGKDDRVPQLTQLAAGAGHCAALGLAVIRARLSGDPLAIAAAENVEKFGTCDPDWYRTIIAYGQFIAANGLNANIPSYKPYMNLSDFVLPPIPGNARIAIVGDWGTGTPAALDVLRSIAAKNPDVLIHLGDVYYSGTAQECQDNFLTPIEQILQAGRATPARIVSLSGNHDMYSGGAGYYGMIDQIGQPSSYFALRTADAAWQFLAMDTGYSDHNPNNVADVRVTLTPQEQTWHLDKIANFSGSTILLSHHQLFSSYSSIGPADQPGNKRLPYNPYLLGSLQAFQASKPIAAWFWGHEHNLTLYSHYLGLLAGRCIGHGAVPATEPDSPYGIQTDLTDIPPALRSPQMPLVAGLYAHGYAMLQLGGDGGTIRADYYAMNAAETVQFTETIAPVTAAV
jgi:predicted phosphodiesterase